MTNHASRLDTFFYRVEHNIPTHRSDIGTLAERKNKYKQYCSRSHLGVGKFINTQGCIDTYTKVDIILTLLEDGHIDHEEYRMRMNKLFIEDNSGLTFNNRAFQSGLESRRQVVIRKASVKQRLRKKLEDKYSQ